jgi:hypothetical protein
MINRWQITKTAKQRAQERREIRDLARAHTEAKILVPGDGVPADLQQDLVALMRVQFEIAMPGCFTRDMADWALWGGLIESESWHFVAFPRWTRPTYSDEADVCAQWLASIRPTLDKIAIWAAVCEAAVDGVDLHLFVRLHASGDISLSKSIIQSLVDEDMYAFTVKKLEGRGILQHLTHFRNPGIMIIGRGIVVEPLVKALKPEEPDSRILAALRGLMRRSRNRLKNPRSATRGGKRRPPATPQRAPVAVAKKAQDSES